MCESNSAKVKDDDASSRWDYARHAHARLAHMQEGTGVADHATFPFDEIKSNVSAFKREQP